ncbi:MAG: hypothetical protein IKG53_02680 [Solobacterium sp.]|nr:hypothetical protein [Solobacterium sp.]
MIRRILVLITAAVLLCGCGAKTDGEQQKEAEDRTVLLEVWGPQEKQAFLNDKITQFQNQNTEQQLEVHLAAEALETVRDTVLTDPAAAADVFLIRREDADLLAEAKVLYALPEGYYVLLKDADSDLAAAVNAYSKNTELALKLVQIIAQ